MRKDLIIAVLMTFCLTTALFMIIPTSSSPTVGEYDPWLDYNDDGAINFLDAILLGASFGTTGDPTKPVIIAGHNYQIISYTEAIRIPPKTGGHINITTAGYTQITIYFDACFAGIPIDGNITVATAFLIDDIHGYIDEFILKWTTIIPPPPRRFLPGYPTLEQRTYSVKAPILSIAYYNQNAYDVFLWVGAYLTT